MKFFMLNKRKLWGDYGSVLLQGMSRHLRRVNGQIQLARTGPFVPPITFPGGGDIIVTQEFRERFERAGFAGISFAPISKARIVDYRWEGWDRTRDDPDEYPPGGKPEDYILSRPHSPSVAEAIGALWEMILPEDATVETERVGLMEYHHRIDGATWRGTPLFRPTGTRYAIATAEVKNWLEESAGEWVIPQEVPPITRQA